MQNRGVEILGVSGDSQKSHQKFTDTYSLPYTLLSDTEHTVMQQYEAWGEKNMYGKKVMGVIRSTFIIDEQGRIAHIFKKVKTDTHSQDVLAALETM